MSDVLQRVRKKYPEYDKVSDEELTWRWGKKYPEYLERDNDFNEQFKTIDQKVRKIKLQHEQRELRKEKILLDQSFDQQFGEPTEEGNWYDQLTYGMVGGLASIGEGGHKILESGARLVGADDAAEFFKGSAEIAGETAREIDMVARATKGAPFVRSLGQGVVSLAPTLAAAPTGPWGMATAAGAQSYGTSLADAERAYKAQGLSDEEAFAKAQIPALFQGLGTALITRGFMRFGGGVEEALLASSVGRATFKETAKNLWKHASLEMTEEESNQLYDSVVRKASYQPDLTFGEALEQIGESGEIGFILGGTMAGVRMIDGNKQSKMLDKAREKYSNELAGRQALEASMPAGFAGEPEPELDAPKWRGTGESLLENVPVPEKLGPGETFTVKFKDANGREGVIEFGDEATRATIERGVAASDVSEITGVDQFTPPPAEEAEPEIESEPEAEVEVEDEYSMTPEEIAAQEESFSEDTIDETEGEPETTPTELSLEKIKADNIKNAKDLRDKLIKSGNKFAAEILTNETIEQQAEELAKEQIEESTEQKEVDALKKARELVEDRYNKAREEALKQEPAKFPSEIAELQGGRINPENYKKVTGEDGFYDPNARPRLNQSIVEAPDFFNESDTKRFNQIRDQELPDSPKTEPVFNELLGEDEQQIIDGNAVAIQWAKLLIEEVPSYKKIRDERRAEWEAGAGQRGLKSWKTKQGRRNRDILDKLDTEPDPDAAEFSGREIAKFPPRGKPKGPTIADVPDAKRTFPDRDIRQF